MKKLLSAALSLALAVVLCSCSPRDLFTHEAVEPEAKMPYLTVEPDKLTYTEGYSPVGCEYSYNALPLDDEQTLYKGIADICYDISADIDEDTQLYPMPKVRVDGPLSEAQVRTVIKAVRDDSPEVFWISGTIGYFSDDSETIVQMYSKYSASEIDDRLSRLHAVANSFYASVPDDLTEYERELLAHDYIVELVEYDTEVDIENAELNDPDIYTAYGALVNGTAVCEGYARAFQLLMNGMGVDCIGISGSAGDELHMWNAVRSGGEWYEVDVTWDDNDKPYYQYAYFNLTTDQMSADHTPSPLFSDMSDDEINGADDDINSDVMNLYIPVSTNITMGYYYRTAPHLSDLKGSNLESALMTAALDRDEIFIFYVDEELDFDSALDSLFKNYPQYFFDYIDAVNADLYDYSIDSSNVGYYPLDNIRIVAVELYYY